MWETNVVPLPSSGLFTSDTATILPSNFAVNIDCPTSFAVSTAGQKTEERVKLVKPERLAFVNLQVEHVAVPNLFGQLTLVEEQQVHFHTRAGLGEDTTGKGGHAIQITRVE